MERDRRFPLTGWVELDDAYLGGERSGGKRGRGAPGKTPYVAAVETNGEGHPLRMKLTVVDRRARPPRPEPHCWRCGPPGGERRRRCAGATPADSAPAVALWPGSATAAGGDDAPPAYTGRDPEHTTQTAPADTHPPARSGNVRCPPGPRTDRGARLPFTLPTVVHRGAECPKMPCGKGFRAMHIRIDRRHRWQPWEDHAVREAVRASRAHGLTRLDSPEYVDRLDDVARRIGRHPRRGPQTRPEDRRLRTCPVARR